LVYLRARDYDPATGQFLSVDPEVDTTDQPYAYAGNDPVSLTDPSGLDFWSDALDAVSAGLAVDARAGGCLLQQAAAFGAGALDSLTFGVSSLVLGAAVPGYNDFVAGHQAAFTAGSVVVMVIQVAVAIIGTAGAGAGLAIGLVALKVAAKTAIKDGAEAVGRAAARAVERDAADSVERTVVIGRNMADRVIPYAEKNGYDFYKGSPKWIPRQIQNFAPKMLQKLDLMFNRKWIGNEMRGGSRIIDIGEPPGMPSSDFFNMESQEASGYWNYVRDLQP
jgi:hypothetical protein